MKLYSVGIAWCRRFESLGFGETEQVGRVDLRYSNYKTERGAFSIQCFFHRRTLDEIGGFCVVSRSKRRPRQVSVKFREGTRRGGNDGDRRFVGLYESRHGPPVLT